jgi:hypothetical protein
VKAHPFKYAYILLIALTQAKAGTFTPEEERELKSKIATSFTRGLKGDETPCELYNDPLLLKASFCTLDFLLLIAIPTAEDKQNSFTDTAKYIQSLFGPDTPEGREYSEALKSFVERNKAR